MTKATPLSPQCTPAPEARLPNFQDSTRLKPQTRVHTLCAASSVGANAGACGPSETNLASTFLPFSDHLQATSVTENIITKFAKTVLSLHHFSFPL